MRASLPVRQGERLAGILPVSGETPPEGFFNDNINQQLMPTGGVISRIADRHEFGRYITPSGLSTKRGVAAPAMDKTILTAGQLLTLP